MAADIFAQKGWICPKCGRVNAPWMPTCGCVSSQTSGTSYLVKTSSISRDSHEIADTPQTESLEQFRVGLEYHTDATHFGKAKGKSVTTDTADTPQTDCDTCRYNSDEWDSPKCDSCSKAHSNYEPQADCPWK